MVANAYVLINVDPAKTQAVVQRLRAVPKAIVHEVLGPFDIVVELEADTQQDLTSTLRHIRAYAGIDKTVTCLWITGPELTGGGE